MAASAGHKAVVRLPVERRVPVDRDENVKYPRRSLNALAHRHSDVAETVAQQAAKKISQESRKHWADFVANMDGRCTVDIYHKQKEHIAVFQHFNHQHVAISKLKNSYFEIFWKNLCHVII